LISRIKKIRLLPVIARGMHTLKQIVSRFGRFLGRSITHPRVKRIHWHLAGRPHHFLLSKSKQYEKWHSWGYHGHVHFVVLGAYTFFVAAYLFTLASPAFGATTSWSQTDWSNGPGSSLQDQFDESQNLNFDVPGEVSLVNRYATGTFKGDQLLNGSTNFNTNVASPLRFNALQEYDNDVFSFSAGDPTRIIVDEAGDYFFSYTHPIESSGSNGGSRNLVISEVRVNNVKVNVGEAASSYIRNTGGQYASSNHLGVLLEGLSAGDYVEVFVRSGTTETGNTLTGSFTTYIEKVDSSEQVFSATATSKTTGTNLNTPQAPLEWVERRKDGAYQHANSSSPHEIILANPGSYFVSVNVPLSSTVQRPNITGRILLDGSQIGGGQFQQGYIRSLDSHNQSSIHWSGLVTTTAANQVLTVTTESEAAGGSVTVGANPATIFIQAVDDGVYDATTTTNSGGSNWVPTSPANINWTTVRQIDSDIYAHSTGSSSHEVTVTSGGDYLLAFNLAASGGGQRTTPGVEVRVNGANLPGAQSWTGYVRNDSGHDSSSNSLLVPLQLNAGDVVSLLVENISTSSGTMNDDTPVTMMLWKKGYFATGSLVSNVYDAGYAVNWGTAGYSSSGSGEIELRVRSDVSSNMGSAPDFSTCDPVAAGSDISENNCVTDGDRYIQYEATLVSDGDTPILNDVTINYEAVDQTPPDVNASDIRMFKAEGVDEVSLGVWTNAATPYFMWDEGEDASGGSGMGGYCLYLGQDSTADPVTTKGLLGQSPTDPKGDCQFKVNTNYVDLSEESLLAESLSTSTEPYYLNVKAIDLAGNVFSGAPAQFEFLLDITEPKNPLFISAPSQFVAEKEVELTWNTNGSGAPSDDDSGIAGLQYKIGNSGTWYGEARTGAEDSSDLLENDGSYITQDPIDFDVLSEGNNVIYFRTWDNAGNVTEANVTAVIKLNTVSPTPVQNITVNPEFSTENSFTFNWLAPASFAGNEQQLTYCYVFNSLPTQSNCNFTAPGERSLPESAYATQPGDNAIYVVAKDEAGNINYAAYGFATFVADTPAPGIPMNVEVADISVKQTENWKVALSWEEPTTVGSGASRYIVERSIDAVNYQEVATTSATSFVDQDLNEVTYYYRIAACRRSNNCGAQTEVVDILPTGRYTSPANLITQPTANNISTRQATIEWITDRVSDSRVAIGTEPGEYGVEEIAKSDQVSVHSIGLTGLNPGQTYYYVAKWTDQDGNTGNSVEKSFTTLPPPNVKDATVARIGLTTASFNFTSTNATEVRMYYGQSEAFGGLLTTNTSTAESTYTVELTGLNDGTEYFYKFNPVDVDGNEYEGTILSFETPPQPRIGSLRFQPLEGEPTSTQEIVWTTNVPTTSAVRYGKVGTTGTLVSASGSTLNHKIKISNLDDDSEYFIIAESRDRDGNLAVSDQQVFRTELDTRPPQVFDVRFESSIRGVGAEARGQVVVSWRTDEPSTSQVAYAEGSSAEVFNSRTAEDAQLSTEHIVVVSDLPVSKVYSLQPISKDRSGNEGVGVPDTVIIGRASESILTTIFNTLQRIFGL